MAGYARVAVGAWLSNLASCPPPPSPTASPPREEPLVASSGRHPPLAHPSNTHPLPSPGPARTTVLTLEYLAVQARGLGCDTASTSASCHIRICGVVVGGELSWVVYPSAILAQAYSCSLQPTVVPPLSWSCHISAYCSPSAVAERSP